MSGVGFPIRIGSSLWGAERCGLERASPVLDLGCGPGQLVRNAWEQIEGLRGHFERHVGKTLLMGRLTHGAGALILLPAGAVRIPFATFFWFNLLGTLPKSQLLLLLGY